MYDHILKKLPKILARENDDPGHQARVDATKDLINSTTRDDEPLTAQQITDLIDGVEKRLKLLNRNLLFALVGQPKTSERLVQAWRNARDFKDLINTLESNTSLITTAYMQMMIAAMDTADVASIKDMSGRGVNVHYEPYTKVLDKEALRLWTEKDPDLKMKLGWQWQALNAHVKVMLLAGLEPPPGCEVKAVPVAKKAG